MFELSSALLDIRFDYWGIKEVTPTDKIKSAYVLLKEQHTAVSNAGLTPSRGKKIKVLTPLESYEKEQCATFYISQRNTSRPGEARMGGAFISKWLNVGDLVLIGSVGNVIYAVKVNGLGDGFFSRWDDMISVLAGQAGTRSKIVVTRMEYDRDPYVVAAALSRANGKCEAPLCSKPLFIKDNGQPYLEVHHIIPLSKGGIDSRSNVAALCPSCHREHHHGQNRENLIKDLIRYIDSL